jgi:hypothetical protein
LKLLYPANPGEPMKTRLNRNSQNLIERSTHLA